MTTSTAPFSQTTKPDQEGDNSDRNRLQSSADNIITTAAASCSAAAAIPIHGVDLVSIALIQTRMLDSLWRTYRQEEPEQLDLLLPATISTCITALISTLGDSVIRQLSAEQLFSTTVVKAAVAGLLTQATGELFQRHLASDNVQVHISGSEVIAFVIDQWQSERYKANDVISKVVKQIANTYL